MEGVRQPFSVPNATKFEVSEVRVVSIVTLIIRQLPQDRRGERVGKLLVAGELASHLLHQRPLEFWGRDRPTHLLHVRLRLPRIQDLHASPVLGEVQRDGRAGGVDGDGARHRAAALRGAARQLAGPRGVRVVVLALVRRLHHRAVLRAPLHLLLDRAGRREGASEALGDGLSRVTFCPYFRH